MSDSLGKRLRLGYDLHEPDPIYAFFLARVLDEGYGEHRTRHWATSERSLAGFGPPLMRSKGDGSEAVVVEIGSAVVVVSLRASFVYAQAAADDAASAESALTHAAELLPTPEPTAAQDVPVMFWTYSPHGPVPSMRKISVPSGARSGRTTRRRRASSSMS
jgi:hypothetical protein